MTAVDTHRSRKTPESHPDLTVFHIPVPQDVLSDAPLTTVTTPLSLKLRVAPGNCGWRGDRCLLSEIPTLAPRPGLP